MSVAIDSFLSQAGLVQVIPNRDYGGLFTIHGDLAQVVHIPLAPDQQVQCEPGTMVYCVSMISTFVGVIKRLELFSPMTARQRSSWEALVDS